MTRYRRIETGTWNDRRFRELSRAIPNGQSLWLYLLCGQRTTIFPGLVVATEAVIASDLGWPLSAELFDAPSPGPRSFREAWKEVADRGMATADWSAGVVVLPKALLDSAGVPRETARPGSPNMFRGWARQWLDIPECELKTDYLRNLGRFAAAIDRIADGNSAEIRANKRVKRGRPRSEKHSRVLYMDVYREAFESSLRALGDQSETGQGPTRVRARVPDPDLLVVRAVPDLAVPDLGIASSGASPPDLGGEPCVDRDPDRSWIRSRGHIVPPAPQDPAAALRRSLVNSFVERVNASRARLATELRIGGVRPIPLMGEGERVLMERLKESTDPVADLDHVLKVSEAEARRTKELRWFGWSLAEPKAWRTRLAATLQEAKAGPRDQRRAEPPSMPVPERFTYEPDIELSEEDRIARDELAARLARGDYETDQRENEETPE